MPTNPTARIHLDDLTSDELDALYDRAEAAQAAVATVLGIVSAWRIEANEVGGVDAGDLAWRLEQAGHPLPNEEA